MSLVTYETDGIQAVKDHVLVKGMDFSDRMTNGGIIVPTDDGKSAGIRPRWAEVVAVGPKQKDIAVGEWVLVGHGRWTRGMKMMVGTEEITLRRVDPADIFLVSEKEYNDETWSTAVAGESDRHRIEGSMHNHAGGGLLD